MGRDANHSGAGLLRLMRGLPIPTLSETGRVSFRAHWSCIRMPSFASALESTLHKALEAASSRRHEYATLEHLLLALVDDEHASKVMSACGVDLGDLKNTVAQYLDTELEALKVDQATDPSPTSGFQ